MDESIRPRTPADLPAEDQAELAEFWAAESHPVNAAFREQDRQNLLDQIARGVL